MSKCISLFISVAVLSVTCYLPVSTGALSTLAEPNTSASVSTVSRQTETSVPRLVAEQDQTRNVEGISSLSQPVTTTIPLESKGTAAMPDSGGTRLLTEDFSTVDFPEDAKLVVRQEDASTVVPREDTTAAAHQVGIVAITRPEVITTLASGKQITAAKNTYEVTLEEGRVPTRADQLVVCHCQDPEQRSPEDCLHFPSGTAIDSKNEMFMDTRRPVSEMKLVMHDVTCDRKDHRFRNFSEGEFYVRMRGDVVLTKNAGLLSGLRINDYCATHSPDENGLMTWKIKACIPPPSVPRCCPAGQALQDGVCVDAATPDLLTPPMSATVHDRPIDWPVIRNHHQPINCTSDPIKSLPLITKTSYIVAIPDGVLHVWVPADRHIMRKYNYPPDYCIDGHVNSDGEINYTANICYTDPEVLHHKICDGHTCVRKCCNEGEEMSQLLYRCIPSNTTYTPQFTVQPSHYRIVYGKPLCLSTTLSEDFITDSRGNLHSKGEILSPKEYCVDRFSDGRGKTTDRAMTCIKSPSKMWVKFKNIALPILYVISLVFLTLTVSCYCLTPKLLQEGGWYQLFYVLSLMVSYACLFAQTRYSGTWEETTCVAMAILLQVAFFCTFFWFNVLCFDVWRRIRSLKNGYITSATHIWVCLIYAFGIPIAIGALTICMHFYAPDGVPGVIKPNLAFGNCWFSDNLRTFLYFYGPISCLFVCNIPFTVQTYWIYRQIKGKSLPLKHRPEITKVMKMNQEHLCNMYNSDFEQQLFLMVVMFIFWASEILSWLIPPPEVWAVTDLFNSLLGVFIFIIIIANSSKRKHLKEKLPLPFKLIQLLWKPFNKGLSFLGSQLKYSVVKQSV